MKQHIYDVLLAIVITSTFCAFMACLHYFPYVTIPLLITALVTFIIKFIRGDFGGTSVP